MFESLHENLVQAFKTLRGKARLTEANMREGLALVEQSLLEADVSYSVVRDFMQRVTERALGQRVLDSLDPSQQVVGIVHEELVRLMGPTDGAKAPPATIRGDFASSIQNNLVHGSDSPENAQAEIALWFKPDELVAWQPVDHAWIAGS